jgi:hypothetical protein
MNENQDKAFKYMSLGFLIAITLFLYFEGVLINLGIGGFIILGVSYVLSILAIYYFIKTNPEIVDTLFPWD